MNTRTASQPDQRWRRARRRLPARLAAVAFGAALGLGTPDLLAQQSQPAPQGAAPAQGTPPPAAEGQPPPELDLTERQFQDWILRCGKSQQGPEVCEMQQQQADKEGRTVMAVAVGTVPGASDPGLLIILPLGIALPAGVTLQVDGGAEVPLVVDRCERQGCRIEMLITPDLMTRLKGGREAKVFFEADNPQGERQRLGVPISLLGFTAALAELTKY